MIDKHEDLMRSINISLTTFIENFEYDNRNNEADAQKLSDTIGSVKKQLDNIDFKPVLNVDVPDTSEKVVDGFREALQGLEDKIAKEVAKIDVKPTVNVPKQAAPVVNVELDTLLDELVKIPNQLAELITIPEQDNEAMESLLDRINTNLVDVAKNTAVQPAFPKSTRVQGKFNSTDFDSVDFGYSGDDVTLITLKSGGSAVRQFAFTYTNGKVSSIARQ